MVYSLTPSLSNQAVQLLPVVSRLAIYMCGSRTSDEGTDVSEVIIGDISRSYGSVDTAYTYLKFETDTRVTQIGEKGYLTLQKAIDEATENDVMKLLMDISENILISDTKTASFTLNVSGNTLSGVSSQEEKPTIKHQGSGTLKII